MFDENTVVLVNGAISLEFDNAVKKYGEKYGSLHEAYAVLKEEYEEVRDEYLAINNALYDAWGNIKQDKEQKVLRDIQACRISAVKLALEAIQVAAVCDKTLKTLGVEEKNG